jgi:hypothetical protein
VRYAIGLFGALIIFLACFALHIAGGATGQDWLFAIAVVLIYLSAAGYPAIAWLLGGRPTGRPYLLAPGALIGLALTTAALRAANDRTFAWWQVPLALAAILATSLVVVLCWRLWERRRALQVEAA